MSDSKEFVCFDELASIRARLREINAIPFEQIIWTRGGGVFDVPPEVAEQWKFTGLSNASFAEFYDVTNETLRDIYVGKKSEARP